MEIRDIQDLPLYARPQALRPFQHRNFRLFFSGQSISLIGTWSQSLAISWLVWRLTGSALWLGLIGFTMQFPMLILGLIGGVAADRFDRRRFLTLLQILCMLEAIILAVLTLTGLIALWQLVVLSIFLGVVYAFEFPVRQAFVMDMVGKRDLLAAVSLSAAMLHGTRILGPMIAGLVVAWKGEGICFLFNAFTFLFLITALALIDRKQLVRVHSERQPLWESIREGLHFVWNEPRARNAIILVVMVTIVGFPFVYLMPIFADEVFGGGAAYMGWLMGASAAGALIGAGVLAQRTSSSRLLTLASGGAVLFGLALVAFSRSDTLSVALPTIAIVGFFLTIVFSSVNTLLQHTAPDHLRGRMMSIFTTAFMGLAPIGSLLGGLSARSFGAQTTVTGCGLICLCGGILFWIRARLIDRREA